MTKREMNCTIRGLKLWTTAGLMLILVLSSGPALAAQINITSCIDTLVKICGFDTADNCCANDRHKLVAGGAGDASDTGHFTCHANCYFIMTVTDPDTGCGCSDPADGFCGNHKYDKIDHSYGSADYLLVGTAQNSKGHYKSSNLTKGSTCP